MNGRPAQVLAIEDNDADRHLLGRALKRLGFSLRTETNGIDGIEAARHLRPDVILLDLGLHGLSGEDVLAVLREHDTTRNIPVVIVTADNDDRREQELLALGAAGYVVKRPDYDALAREVVETCGLSPR